MARVGRGALVGLPAVGALFVAHLAHQDWHRLTEERAAGEQYLRGTAGGRGGVRGVDLGLECRLFGWEARFTGTGLFVAHLAHQD